MQGLRRQHQRYVAPHEARADRPTRAVATLLVAVATLAIVFPSGGTAAPAVTRDLTSRSSIVVETFGASLPNDPNRCVTSIFVEFPDIRGATSYSARILNRGFSPPREQTFGATPPNFPADSYTVTLAPGVSRTFVAPAGRHRIFISGGSSGSGCTTTSWIDLLSMNVDAPPNEPPDASFTWEAHNGAPLTVDFDGSSSTDDVGIDSYAWSFGDGGSASGASPPHTFAADGTFTVTLTVTDTEGEMDSEQQLVAVSSGSSGGGDARDPVAAFTATPSPSDPYTFQIDGSGSTDDGRIVSYDWDFGDGTTGSGVTLPHTFPGHGTYDVALTITDDDGLEDTLVVSVLANASPEASFEWSVSPANRLAIEVDAGQSTDDSAIEEYEWSFGDGTTGSGQATTHEYAGPGSYSVTLVVTDDDAAQAATSIAVVVAVDGAYLLQLQAVHGEAADLLLDRDGDVVAVECSFGSVLGPAIGTISKVFGSGLDPACVDGFFPLTLEPALGDVPRLMSSLAESFGGAKVFPESKTDRQFGQLVKALGVENGAKGFGLLQSLVDTVPLPPAQDGIVSVTPPKQTGKELGGLMQEAGGLIQSMTQGQSLMQTLTEALETVIPRAP